MHRRASFLCAVFRYARQTFTAWPGDWLNARSGASTPSFLHFSPGGAPGFFAPLAGLFPRTGVAPFPAFRAHVSFLLAARPPRLVFVGVTSRLVESTLEKAVGRGLCSVRDDRLLGFTPVCDPHPAAPRCQNTVCHEIDPASGFASCRVGGRLTAHRNRARPRIRSSASGNTPIAFTRTARPYPLMGFRPLAPIANRRGCRPFSVLMGLTPG
jgi:hypothetical protein